MPTRAGSASPSSLGSRPLSRQERIVEPDVLINLRGLKGARRGVEHWCDATIGAEVALDALSRHDVVLRQFSCSGGSRRQRRDAIRFGTSGHRRQCRPAAVVLVLPERIPPATRRAESSATRLPVRNQFHHAIFGGIIRATVHPSDTAPALVASTRHSGLLVPVGNASIAQRLRAAASERGTRERPRQRRCDR